MTEDAFVVTFQPAKRAKRRLVFEPRGDVFLRREEVIDHAGEWRAVGSERVETVTFERPEE